MAKMRRKLVSVSAEVPAAPVWPNPFVVFADLHVDARTLTQACAVLDEVGELAAERKAAIVCLGDFWNLRGTLNVRQVDEVLRRMEQWQSECYFVPGNHDQVTLDGLVHGLNIFRPFPNVRVIDKSTIVPPWGVTFVPWREHDQADGFKLFEGQPLTVFGHAEVGGAIANSGKQAAGKVALGVLEAHRAVYLGHYHKRQRLGGNVWYIGSPYQQNSGERDDPHGIAVVHADRIEPEFVNLDDLPKYWRFDLGTAWDTSRVREQDIAEVVVPRDQIGSENYRKSIEAIPAGTIRAKPLEEPEDAVGSASFALGLVDALDQYVTEHAGESGLDADALRDLGRAILSEIPEARARGALGPSIEIGALRIRDFCALRGELSVPIEAVDFTLLRGPVRTGKTAVADAVTWCLYGQTSPRKAGQTSATFRGDDVIHDDAPSCMVECEVTVAGLPVPVRVRREKLRGKGAKITIDGGPDASGISDQQVLLDRLIGIPYALWRVCVSVGQGAVANFATDADKRRKEALEVAFDLESCPKAQALARVREREAQTAFDDLRQQRVVAEGQHASLSAFDFTGPIAQWEAQRAEAITSLRAKGEETKASKEKCVAMLAGEAEWLTSRGLHEKQIETLTTALATAGTSQRIAELQRQYGGLEAEAAIIQRDLGLAKTKLETAVSQASAGGQPVCPTCGQALPQGGAEEHMRALEAAVRSKQFEATTFQSRMANVTVELDALNTSSSGELDGMKVQIEASRTALQQCGEALTQFARIRENLKAVDRQLEDLRTRFREQSALKNPHEEQAEQARKTLDELRVRIDALTAEAEAADKKLRMAAFWAEGFGPKGIPVLVLRTVIYDLESAANRHLAMLLDGTLLCRLSMLGDDLGITYLETVPTGEVRERSYEQLSGGQRRCAELAFCPLGLSDVIFARRGVRIPLLMIDELTTHLGEDQKPRACDLLAAIGRKVLVIDHDAAVQGHFDHVWSLARDATGVRLAVA